MEVNYYKGNEEHPWHLSVGAVVINDKKEIACHYFKEVNLKTYDYKDKAYNDVYILMRETLELGETLEQALSRGLMEEFGIKGTPVSYIGSIKANFPDHDKLIEKTTLYFLVDLIYFDPTARSTNDPESDSEIQWLPIDALIVKLRESSKKTNREDADESLILERIQKLIQTR